MNWRKQQIGQILIGQGRTLSSHRYKAGMQPDSSRTIARPPLLLPPLWARCRAKAEEAQEQE
eukprot:15448146-Alexandrium_andersonii.AAC.1